MLKQKFREIAQFWSNISCFCNNKYFVKSEFKKQLVPDRVLPRLNIFCFSPIELDCWHHVILLQLGICFNKINFMMFLMILETNQFNVVVKWMHFKVFFTTNHSSEIRGLCLMKWPIKILQNLPYFIYTKTQSCFFHFSFYTTLFFP